MAKTKFYTDKELAYLLNQQLIGDCLDDYFQPDGLDCSLINVADAELNIGDEQPINFYRM
ncbi:MULTISPECIES: hypothetical protein [unclassified Pseudoalteromonas]|uniref:hypothetical protein n=1 Tax=unclassified Pseudoalteromonas TaxID=194690 RepID=UPI0020974AB4|nr:hypothetical protein [Pseudoalteromonas sp. XMcav2-N]MCO7191372.1 hypothetical protein [Pseudoalteromonas sp. XMcav2-N]